MNLEEKLKKQQYKEIWQQYCGFLDLSMDGYMKIQRRLMEEQIRLWSNCGLGQSILKGKYPQEMCVKDIGYRMIEKNSNVPRIIDRLVDKKLVKRNQGEQDGRQTVIQLTQAGLKILASSTIKINELYDNILSLNNKEAETLNNLLEKIRETEA